MDLSKNSGTPKSSILIGFSIIFTIHFGVFPLFLETPIWLYFFGMKKMYSLHWDYIPLRLATVQGGFDWFLGSYATLTSSLTNRFGVQEFSVRGVWGVAIYTLED